MNENEEQKLTKKNYLIIFLFLGEVYTIITFIMTIKTARKAKRENEKREENTISE